MPFLLFASLPDPQPKPFAALAKVPKRLNLYNDPGPMTSYAESHAINQYPAAQKSTDSSRETALNLSDLYWLLRVVEAGSFSAASEQSGISKSSLSRRISQLEQRLGVKLLNRGPRNFILTSTGEQVYRHALDMLSAVEAATECAYQAAELPRGEVSLSIPAILADWLLPFLTDFCDRYPDISLSIDTADNVTDLAALRLDLALCLQSPPDNTLQIVSRPIAQLAFAELVGGGKHQQRNTIQVNNLLMARQVAKAGQGQACLPLCVCQKELSSGELVRANDHLSHKTLFAFTLPARNITLATRTLLDFLTAQLALNRWNTQATQA